MVIKMRYAVDEIIDSVVKLENIETGDIIIEDISLFPDYICEGNIVFKVEKYQIDYDYEKNRKKFIQDKLNKIKGLR